MTTVHFDNMTLEEVEILNSEVTDEIREILLDLKKEKKLEKQLEDEVARRVATLSDGDKDRAYSDLVDLQARMKKGMKEINKMKQEIDSWWDDFQTWKPSVYHAWINRDLLKEVRGDFYARSAVLISTSHWKYPLTVERAAKYLNHSGNKEIIRLWTESQRYWNHWNKLKEECKALAKEHPAIWPEYFKEEENQEDQGDYTPRHVYKQSDPLVDNRMLTSDEAYYYGHQEEQQELFVYNS